MAKKDEHQQAEEEQRAAEAELDEDTELNEDEGRNQAGLKTHVNETREAIMKKSTSDRLRRKKADTEQLDDEGKALQAAMEAEVRGESNEFDVEQADAAPDEPEASPEAAETEPETVDTNDDLVTIKVDGEEQQVSKRAVEQAGIAALQKESAADKRMKEVSDYELSVRNLEASVRKQLEDLQSQQPATDGKVVGDGQANLPDEGAVAQAVAEQAAKVAEAIYAGDEDQVKEGLVAALTSVVQGRQGSTPPLDAKQFAQDVMVNMRTMADEEAKARKAEEHAQVAKTVNATFQKEFADLYQDDRGFRLTKAEFDTLCEQQPEADRVELMRQAATTVDKIVNPPVADELSKRKARKRAADADAPSTAQRVPQDKPAAKKSRKDVVADMQRSRGQRTG